MNELKKLLTNLLRDVRNADFKSPQVIAAALLFLSVPVVVATVAYNSGRNSNNIRASSVMIGNHEMNHGGTGVILKSTRSSSTILTNGHVCKVVENGGVVRTETGDYQVVAVRESKLSDLCTLKVAANLGTNTSVSGTAPQFYDKALISGHPALMPNIVTEGHFSGRKIITVLTGMRPCTEDEAKDEKTGLICAFFGGLPVIKSYESILVSATIMPGSSGSGVYNIKQELSGVVFAGQGNIGYAWTVPYEQLVNFLRYEEPNLPDQVISQEVSPINSSEKQLEMIAQKCTQQNITEIQVKEVCKLLEHDVTWRE